MSMRLVLAATVLAMGAAGCDAIRSFMPGGGGAAQAPGEEADTAQAAAFDQGAETAVAAPEAAGDPTPTRGTRDIQFPEAARPAATAMGLDVGKFADASVPVVAPSSLSQEQSDQLTSSYRATPDGYFARWSDEDFDVVVNGTRVYSDAPAAAGAPAARDLSTPKVSETETGMSVTVSKFGADYNIELVCRGAGDEGGSGCATQEEAEALVDRLVPVGGGGR
jgi:hypothetical protein